MENQEENKMNLPKIPKGIIREHPTRLFRFKIGQFRGTNPTNGFRFSFDSDCIKTTYHPMGHFLEKNPVYNISLYGSNVGMTVVVTKKDILDMLKIIEETEKLAGKEISLEQFEIDFN